MTFEEDMMKELKKISKLITLSNGNALKAEIEKYATTDDRKRIGVLINGTRQSDEVAKIISTTRRTVDTFLKILEDASLVERQFNKPPTRIIDFVPVEWIELAQESVKQPETEQQSKSDAPTTQNGDQNG